LGASSQFFTAGNTRNDAERKTVPNSASTEPAGTDDAIGNFGRNAWHGNSVSNDSYAVPFNCNSYS
jgi:hypothetical protein